jgi:hypothetical protein
MNLFKAIQKGCLNNDTDTLPFFQKRDVWAAGNELEHALPVHLRELTRFLTLSIAKGFHFVSLRMTNNTETLSLLVFLKRSDGGIQPRQRDEGSRFPR